MCRERIQITCQVLTTSLCNNYRDKIHNNIQAILLALSSDCKRLTRLEAHGATLPSRLRVRTVSWRTVHILTLHDSCLWPYGGCSKGGGGEKKYQDRNCTQQIEHSSKPRAWQRHCANSMVQTTTRGHVVLAIGNWILTAYKSKIQVHAFYSQSGDACVHACAQPVSTHQ